MNSSKNRNQSILKCIDLKKNYKLGDIIVPVLRGLSLRVSRGQMISIMGPSGSGKTTLFNLIGGLDHPTEGKIELEGKNLAKMSNKELIKIRRYKIGFIFQTYNLLPTLTAFENIRLPMLIAGVSKKTRNNRVNELLEMVGLNDRKNHKPDKLSEGEKQRISIARALANKPAIILSDELTGELDFETGDRIIKLLKKINKIDGQTMIIVTHDQGVAKQTDITYHLKNGVF